MADLPGRVHRLTGPTHDAIVWLSYGCPVYETSTARSWMVALRPSSATGCLSTYGLRRSRPAWLPFAAGSACGKERDEVGNLSRWIPITHCETRRHCLLASRGLRRPIGHLGAHGAGGDGVGGCLKTNLAGFAGWETTWSEPCGLACEPLCAGFFSTLLGEDAVGSLAARPYTQTPMRNAGVCGQSPYVRWVHRISGQSREHSCALSVSLCAF